MKSLLYYLLVATLCWQAYQHFNNVPEPVPAQVPTYIENIPANEPTVDWQPPKAYTTAAGQQFKCDGRTHCSQMTSLAEAQFFLQHCPDTKMDGDKDGNPCERQFEN